MEAFERALTEDAYRAAWRYASYLEKVPESAQDLLQDALAHAYLRFSQLHDHERFKGWLLNIVRTQFLMERRRSKRRSQHLDWTGREPGLAAANTDNVLPLEACLPPELAAVLHRLPPKLREIIELYYLQDLDLDQAAQVAGISTGAAKARLFRGRKRLRALLTSRMPGAETGLLAGGENDGAA